MTSEFPIMVETNPNWILVEEEALKAVLQGMTVADSKNASRKVTVWFGQPDVELREQIYPYVTVDLIDVSEAKERAHRNRIELWYTPEGAPKRDDGKGYVTDYPIAYNLTFQITTYARHPRHDRQIIRQMASRIGGRYRTLHIPQDDTVRSMFVLGTQKRDSTEAGRRLFSNAYTLQVFSELLPTEIEAIQKVLAVRVGDIDFTFKKHPYS